MIARFNITQPKMFWRCHHIMKTLNDEILSYLTQVAFNKAKGISPIQTWMTAVNVVNTDLQFLYFFKEVANQNGSCKFWIFCVLYLLCSSNLKEKIDATPSYLQYILLFGISQCLKAKIDQISSMCWLFSFAKSEKINNFFNESDTALKVMERMSERHLPKFK